MKCPTCIDLELQNGECLRCKGAWLDHATLAEKIARPLDPGRGRVCELLCPVCRGYLGTYLVFGVQIERCPLHGIWFDRTELEKVMKLSGRGQRD